MKLILIALATVLTAGAACAEGNGNRNVGQLNGNLNANGNASSTASYEGYNGADSHVSNNNTYKNRNPGAIGAPGLTSGAGTCLGSVSGGVSLAAGAFGGFGFGTTYLERNCESRAVADQLYRYGYRKAAIQVLLNEHPMANRAMVDVGSARRKGSR